MRLIIIGKYIFTFLKKLAIFPDEVFTYTDFTNRDASPAKAIGQGAAIS
jgi:hypothetical protein